MPYIPKQNRNWLSVSRVMPPQTPGELNFAFTDTITAYIRHKGLSYATINDIIGALEGAKLEFYRRVAVPYEESKRAENGDVY